MSSKIKVDTIENVAGSGNVSLGSGHNLVVPGNLNVDTNLLDVDASNDTVGIGTTVNTRKLNINAGSFGHMLLDTADASHGIQILGQTNATANSGFDIQYSSAGGLKMRTLAVKGMSFQTSASAGSPAEHLAIDTAGRVTTPNRPAFLAYGSPTVDSLSGSYGHLYNFTNHSGGGYSYNIGSHYNNSTGRFTAPVAGKYYFHGSIYRAQDYTGGANQMIMFSKNNDNSGNLLGTNAVGGQYQQITVTAVFHLAANDYINFLLYAGSGSFSIQGSEPRNYFLGYQIS